MLSASCLSQCSHIVQSVNLLYEPGKPQSHIGFSVFAFFFSMFIRILVLKLSLTARLPLLNFQLACRLVNLKQAR